MRLLAPLTGLLSPAPVERSPPVVCEGQHEDVIAGHGVVQRVREGDEDPDANRLASERGRFGKREDLVECVLELVDEGIAEAGALGVVVGRGLVELALRRRMEPEAAAHRRAARALASASSALTVPTAPEATSW